MATVLNYEEIGKNYIVETKRTLKIKRIFEHR